ncbi:MAG: hypothetical protein AABY22_07960 [Nanoarchaeota archaeon]
MEKQKFMITVKASINNMVDRGTIKEEAQEELIILFELISSSLKEMKSSLDVQTERINLLSLENSKLIEKLDKAKNLGFID